MACSKCGESGHYASTCSRKAKAKEPSGAKRKAGVAVKSAAAPAIVHLQPPTAEGGSVIEQLEARRAQLRQQLEGVEKMKREIEIIEGFIGELRSLGGGA